METIGSVGGAMTTTMPEFEDQELLRYSRQILLPEWDLEAQYRLKQSKVVLIGVGGLGTVSAQLLARAGVGELVLVDADTVDDSNLQRQVLFEPEDIGAPKAVVAAQKLQHTTPWLKVTARLERVDQASLQEIVQDCTLVLDGTDNFATRDLINLVCHALGIPLISAAAIGMVGQLSYFPPEGPCYRCLFGESGIDDRSCAANGVLASTPQIMATLQAHHALLALGLSLSPLAGKLLLWDGMTGEQRLIRFSHDPDCVICGHTLASPL